MKHWRHCSSCKKEIGFDTKYYECSVSTCTGKRTGFVFCSLPCFERHLPGARHRDAGAVEMRSPRQIDWERENQEVASSASLMPASPTRRLVSATPGPSPGVSRGSIPSGSQDEVLIVVSKLKQYIRDRAEMNTSGDVADILSDLVRRLCDDAIDEARAEGRKTVMARDFKKR